jgi:hypothetical protein
MKSTIFWDITPCSPLSVNRCSSETLVDTQRTTWRYIPEDGTLHNHRCEHLKSYILKISLKHYDKFFSLKLLLLYHTLLLIQLCEHIQYLTYQKQYTASYLC